MDFQKKLVVNSLVEAPGRRQPEPARLTEAKFLDVNRQTLQIDPPSQRGTIHGVPDFEYDKYKQAPLQKRNVPAQRVQTLNELEEPSRASHVVSFVSEFNSDKNSVNYDSQVLIEKLRGDSQGSEVGGPGHQSHFLQKEGPLHAKFQSDFYMVSKSKKKPAANDFLPGNLGGKPQTNEFLIEEKQIFETNDRDAGFASEIYDTQKGKRNI